ncbi:MAG TPA: hypothetical protein VEC16_06730 [Alphaproteobacteria bacterium]|nr:hypothetical protein [Alphaproteobacteria bacterium]
MEITKSEEKLKEKTEQLRDYYSLKLEENNKDTQILAKNSEVIQLQTYVFNKTNFFDDWFRNLKEKDANRIINSKKIGIYKYIFQNTRDSTGYNRGEEIEEVINLKNIVGSESFYDIYHMITRKYEFNFNGKKIGIEGLVPKCWDKNPQIREEAYKQILEKYSQDSAILSELYKNIVLDRYNEGVKIHKYKDSLSIFTENSFITNKALNLMLDIVRKNKDIFSEYFNIKSYFNKKQGYKYNNSKYHLYAPIIFDEPKKYSFQDMEKIILNTFKRFDERFYVNAKKIFEENHIHAKKMPNKNKEAFNMKVPNHSPYILINPSGDLKSVLDTMHEFGHAIHDEFSSKQSYFFRTVPPIIQEIPSIFAETLLHNTMLNNSKNNKEKIEILANLLESQYQTIVVQSYHAMFEKYTHENIPKGASKQDIDNKYYELLKDRLSTFRIDEAFKEEWLSIHHFYDNPFYCSGYSWGNLTSLFLYDKYRTEGKKFVDKYVEFLSYGGLKDTYPLMKILGANPRKEEFWQTGFDIIKEEINELKKLI